MKFLIYFSLLLTSYTASANPCMYQCNTQCRRYAEQLANELDQITNLCGELAPPDAVYPGRPRPYPHPRPQVQVELFGSDSCTSSHLGFVNHSTNCSVFRGQNAWGIKVGGICHNIQDMDGQTACEAFRYAGLPNSIEAYSTDSCNGGLTGLIGPTTQCEHMSDRQVWGIKVEGRCINVADTTLRTACTNFKSVRNQGSVKLYSTDSCNGGLVAAVDRGTNCSALANTSQAVWGAEVNGQCINIQDTNLQRACELYKNQGR
jgi:hypothetical protein